jgi:nitroreductase
MIKQEMLQGLMERRSVRAYQKEQIAEEALDAVLRAGQYAPSGRNRMPVQFVAIQNPQLLARLSAWNAEIMGKPEVDPFYGAPTAILVLADGTVPTYQEDGALAMGNLMHAAYAVGLGSCWIHRAKEMFASEAGKALLAKWGISPEFCGIGFCVLGYAAGALPKASPRREDQILKIR